MTDGLDLRRLPQELVWLLGVVGGRVAPADHMEPALLLRLTAHHRLAPHLDAALSPDVALPAPLRQGLHGAVRRAGLRALGRAADLASLIATLEAAGIEVVALKGPALALLLYGDAARRDCCDLDLLVRPEQMPAAVAVLSGLGFEETPHQLPGYHLQLHHRRRALTVELHVRLAKDARLFPLDPWASTVTLTLGGVPVRTLAPPAAVVYAATHGCRHVWNRLGWLTDIAAAARHPAIDWTEAFALSRRLGVDRQLTMALVLARDLLGAPQPAGVGDGPLRAAAARAVVMAPAFPVPPVSEREAMYRIGLLRFLHWEAWQFRGTARWVALQRHLRVPLRDRRTFPLPWWLEPARPLLRVLRICSRMLRRDYC